MEMQQEYNRNYAEFLNSAVFPRTSFGHCHSGIVHRVITWAIALPSRNLAWRWGELVIMQSHEDAFRSSTLITEGKAGRRLRPTTPTYDLAPAACPCGAARAQFSSVAWPRSVDPHPSLRFLPAKAPA